MEYSDLDINTILTMSIIFLFIIAMSVVGLCFYVIKKTFESTDETDFGIQNRLIGKIWHRKVPKDHNEDAP